jgi:hypothetical protein
VTCAPPHGTPLYNIRRNGPSTKPAPIDSANCWLVHQQSLVKADPRKLASKLWGGSAADCRRCEPSGSQACCLSLEPRPHRSVIRRSPVANRYSPKSARHLPCSRLISGHGT